MEPHWLSDGGGEVGVYHPHDNIKHLKKFKKKIKNFSKKNLKNFKN